MRQVAETMPQFMAGQVLPPVVLLPTTGLAAEQVIGVSVGEDHAAGQGVAVGSRPDPVHPRTGCGGVGIKLFTGLYADVGGDVGAAPAGVSIQRWHADVLHVDPETER